MKVLGLSNSAKHLNKLDDDEKGLNTIPTLGGLQQVNMINESGLYGLAFRSRKPYAKKFRKWVTSEVLPSIFKTGGYINPEASNEQIEYLQDQLKTMQKRNKLLENQNKIFGNRTPYALPSKTNGNPRVKPVRGYLRSTEEPVVVDKPLVQVCFNFA